MRRKEEGQREQSEEEEEEGDGGQEEMEAWLCVCECVRPGWPGQLPVGNIGVWAAAFHPDKRRTKKGKLWICFTKSLKTEASLASLFWTYWTRLVLVMP